MENSKYLLLLFAAILLSFFQHKEFLQLDIQGIHTWRQSQTMWNIRNFARHDANILNPRVSHFNNKENNIYRYEFPIMQWSIAMIQKQFGEKIEIVRSAVFLIGIFSIFGIFLLVNLVVGNALTALITAILFQYSPVFYYYTINPIPDNLSLCAGIWYLYFILSFYKTNKYTHLIASSFFLMLATFAKLPFLMFSIVSIYFFIKEIIEKKTLTKSNFLIATTQTIILIPAILWYAWVMPAWESNPVLGGIFGEELSLWSYLGIVKYHLLRMFPQILLSPPILLLLAAGGYHLYKEKFKPAWLYALIGITFLYLILEFNTINRHHDYYMFPFLPWLFIVIGFGVEFVRNYHQKTIFLLAGIVFLSCIYTPYTTAINWSLDKTDFNKDVFLYQNELKNAVPKDAKCIIINDNSNFIFSYQIDKMGYVFSGDHLSADWIKDMVYNRGVDYMYSDSKKINTDTAIATYIDKTILEVGSIKVYKLKKA